jgi:hypothetical protein
MGDMDMLESYLHRKPFSCFHRLTGYKGVIPIAFSALQLDVREILEIFFFKLPGIYRHRSGVEHVV